MHGLTGGDWKRIGDPPFLRQSPTLLSSLAVVFGTIMHASSGPFVEIRGSEAFDGVDAFVLDPGGFGAAGQDHFVGS